MTRNVEMLVRAARALGDLRDEVVFVGGAVVDLFITDPAAPRPRFTEDVDVVVEVTTHGAWSRLGERLRSLGFREDQREGAPLCRWRFGDLAIDVMPVLERVLGFSNRWYRMARKQSEERELPGGVRIRVVLAPLFVATKMEAFRSRGRGDLVASHDIEDLIAVVDGRPELADEAKLAPAQLRRSLRTTITRWLEDARFLDAVPGHLPGDSASQARAPSCSRGCDRSRVPRPPSDRRVAHDGAGHVGRGDHRVPGPGADVRRRLRVEIAGTRKLPRTPASPGQPLAANSAGDARRAS